MLLLTILVQTFSLCFKAEEYLPIYVSQSELTCLEFPCDGSSQRPFKKITDAFEKLDKLIEEKGSGVGLVFDILLDANAPGFYQITDNHLSTPKRQVFFEKSKSNS